MMRPLLLLCFVVAASCFTCNVTQIPNAINKNGYCSSIWYSGLNSPRGLFTMSNGDILVVEAGSGQVSVLWEAYPGVVNKVVLATQSGLDHGIAWANNYVYASNPTNVYRWPYTVGSRTPITASATNVIQGMPTGDHNTRTLLFGSNLNVLYVSVGSGDNVVESPDRAGVYTFDLTQTLPLSYAQKTTISHGNRNGVGIRFDASGQLWEVENGADNLYRSDLGGDIHNTNPGEEINLLSGGKFYGYPYCWSQYNLTTVTTPKGTQYYWPGINDSLYTDAWCRNVTNNTPPKYVLQAHSAPLDIIFKQGQHFPSIPDGDAFVAQHGSWDATPPAGYAVAHVTWTNGVPVADEPMLKYAGPGATGSGWHRPVGLAWTKCQGADCLLVSSDTTGVIIAMTNNNDCVCQTMACGTANENGVATITCPAQQVVNNVQFASFGTPYGSCGNFHKSSCDATSSVSVVQNSCLGKNTCSLGANINVFQDPCPNTFKYLDIQVGCAPAAPPAPPVSVCAAWVGENSNVNITCPSASQKISSVQFASYGTATGSCTSTGSTFVKGSCDATTSTSVFSTNCLNKNSCVFLVGNGAFGDPCPYTYKHFDVQATCS